jgi:hypothetical protein
MHAGRSGVWGVAAALGLGLCGASAHAQDLSACGENMWVKAEASCELVPPAECEVMCTPASIEAVCAAELTAKCDGQCNLQAEARCTADCSGSCMADCMVDPGKFDCTVECQGSCEADCDARCAGGKGGSHCAASCRANCSGSCNAKCDVRAPQVDCQAKCQASCSGSCEAKANADCQIDCQADFDAKCDFEVEGGCKAECRKNPDGGLFCDGQIVKSSNIEECADAIRSLLDGEVDLSASGSAVCENGECTAEGKSSAMCSMAPGAGNAAGLASAMLSVGLVALLRRRRD